MRFDLAFLTAAAAMAPPAWASAAMLLVVVALFLLLHRTSEMAWPFARRRRPVLARSGEAARRRLGLAHAPFR